MANPNEEGMLEREADRLRHDYEAERGIGTDPERDWYHEFRELVSKAVMILTVAQDGGGGLSEDDLEFLVNTLTKPINAVYAPMMNNLMLEALRT